MACTSSLASSLARLRGMSKEPEASSVVFVDSSVGLGVSIMPYSSHFPESLGSAGLASCL